MSSRTLILRKAGYEVDDARTVKQAISLLGADSIEVMLICHTIGKEDQQLLISTARQKKRLMPILCLRAISFESVPATCRAVDVDPEDLLYALHQAVRATSPGPNCQARIDGTVQ